LGQVSVYVFRILGDAGEVWGEYYRYRLAYVALFALLATDCLIGFVLAGAFGISRPGTFLMGLAVFPVLLFWFVRAPVWAVLTRKPEPTRWIFKTYRQGAMWLVIVAFLTLFAWGKASNIAPLKTAIPLVVPFYADQLLADLDRAIFFTDPWRITHFFIRGWGTRALDAIYSTWHIVHYVFC
jgi:hypothetical protein